MHRYTSGIRSVPNSSLLYLYIATCKHVFIAHFKCDLNYYAVVLQEISYLAVANIHKNPLPPRVSWYAQNTSQQQHGLLEFAVHICQESGENGVYLNKTIPLRHVSYTVLLLYVSLSVPGRYVSNFAPAAICTRAVFCLHAA